MYYIGAPVGRRCLIKYGGELLIITEDGLYPMSGALQSSRMNPKTALTDKIQNEMSIAVESYGTNYGWQLELFPPENMLLMNVPVATGNNQEQYVMNTITGAWCKFTGWNANCFTLFSDDQLYFGGDTFVGRAWNTNADNATAINATGLQAFSYFGNPGQVKRFTLMRPTFYVNGNISIQGSISVDFDQSAPESALTTTPINEALWDSGTWDISLWADNLTLSRLWQGTTGVGYSGAPRIAVQSNGFRLQWLATEIVLEPGAIL